MPLHAPSMPPCRIETWLPFLRDPLDTEKTLRRVPFAGGAQIGPFRGREWGVLVSAGGTLFPYYGSLVCFEQTPEAAALFAATRTELARCGLCTTHSLVGDESTSTIHSGDGLFSADQVDGYDQTIVHPPFWQAIEHRVFSVWDRDLPDREDGPVLDLGCGTGRCLRKYSDRGFRMLGVDASYPMLAAAAETKLGARCLLLLASAARLPLKDESIAASTCFGTLHHLARPRTAFAEIFRVLKPEAALLALEPNDSPVRFLFDALSKSCPLWEEEAGEGTLLSPRKLRRSTPGNWDWNFRYSVFVPPQLLALLGHPLWIRRALGASDWLGRIPGIRSMAGLLILTARKKQ